jgi:hypothetical protein
MKIAMSPGVTRAIGRTILQTKKNSPHIFFAAGVASVAGSAILACKATLKLEKELDQIKASVERVKAAEGISDQERQRLLAVKYGRGVGRLARLYGPAGILFVAGVGALTGSHVQLTRRNAAVSGALAMISQSFNDYRDRNREVIGEEKELEIFHGVTTEEVTEGGKKQKVKVLGDFNRAGFSREFNEQNLYWQGPNLEVNLGFLRCQEKYWNDRLIGHGHVFLNEVYEALGFDHTSEGAIVGWVKNENHDPAGGYGRIDFGVFNNFQNINGMENRILLDFNVDPGVMYDKI